MPDIFVTPRDIDENEAKIVDVRDRDEYINGHLPRAVNVPFDDFRDPTDETEGKLPTAEGWGSLLGNAGITPEDEVVVYDDEFGVYASRFLVTAEVFGHSIGSLHLLDGDYTAWKRDRSVSTDEAGVETRRYDCERTGDGPLVSAEELDAAIDTDTVIVDTRNPIEYDTVHIPGAVNFGWRSLVNEDRRRLKPDDRCEEILAEAGISLDRPVRLYCNTARRLSFVYAVLRELGHDDVAIYEGGIAEWSKYGGSVETS